TSFASQMKSILQTLEDAYDYPVDIEFTVNFTEDNNYRINIVQCRPQQTKWETAPVDIPEILQPDNYFISSPGHFLGGNVVLPVKRVIYVHPGNYSSLNQTQKYDIARYIGKLNRLTPGRSDTSVMLIGPGRWGTTTPSLGIPVRFSEINNTSILVEMALMGGDFVPELSYGTHFFQDLVESEIFYIALLPEKKDVLFNLELIEKYYVPLETFLDDGARYSSIIQVYDDIPSLFLMSDIRTQKVVSFFMDKT
ncbi:MAG: PEP/pyruvate-binding domain-containing protein, partial [Spirochaetota bacterium]